MDTSGTKGTNGVVATTSTTQRQRKRTYCVEAPIDLEPDQINCGQYSWVIGVIYQNENGERKRRYLMSNHNQIEERSMENRFKNCIVRPTIDTAQEVADIMDIKFRQKDTMLVVHGSPPAVAGQLTKVEQLYHNFLNCGSAQEALTMIKKIAPQSWVMHRQKLIDEAKIEHAVAPPPLQKFASTSFNVPLLKWGKCVARDESMSFALIGAAGCGKTQFALSHFDNPAFVTSNEDLAKYDETVHDGIVVDDYDTSHLSSQVFISLVDSDCPRTFDIKYGRVTIPPDTKKIFCTNERAKLIPPKLTPAELKAVTRRLKIYIVQKPLFDLIPEQSHPADCYTESVLGAALTPEVMPMSQPGAESYAMKSSAATVTPTDVPTDDSTDNLPERPPELGGVSWPMNDGNPAVKSSPGIAASVSSSVEPPPRHATATHDDSIDWTEMISAEDEELCLQFVNTLEQRESSAITAEDTNPGEVVFKTAGGKRLQTPSAGALARARKSFLEAAESSTPLQRQPQRKLELTSTPAIGHNYMTKAWKPPAKLSSSAISAGQQQQQHRASTSFDPRSSSYAAGSSSSSWSTFTPPSATGHNGARDSSSSSARDSSSSSARDSSSSSARDSSSSSARDSSSSSTRHCDDDYVGPKPKWARDSILKVGRGSYHRTTTTTNKRPERDNIGTNDRARSRSPLRSPSTSSPQRRDGHLSQQRQSSSAASGSTQQGRGSSGAGYRGAFQSRRKL